MVRRNMNRRPARLVLPLVLAIAASASAQVRPRPAPPSKPVSSGPFTTPLTIAEMSHKPAVVATSMGSFVIDLRPDLAPNHVGYFMKLARDGAYNGTIFHRVIALA